MKTYLFIGAILLANSTSAFADTPEIKVNFHDLNLVSKEGVARLDRRIRSAADRVCGAKASTLDLAAARAARHCRTAALAPALQRAHMLAMQTGGDHQLASSD